MLRPWRLRVCVCSPLPNSSSACPGMAARGPRHSAGILSATVGRSSCSNPRLEVSDMAGIQDRVKEMYEAHPFPRLADPLDPEWIERTERYFRYLGLTADH